jgi:hypothetical protein
MKPQKHYIHQMVVTALAKMISALMADDYLANRAKRARRAKFEHAMARVSKESPAEHDRLVVSRK